MHRTTFERNSSQGTITGSEMGTKHTSYEGLLLLITYSQKRRGTYSIFRLVGSGDRVKRSLSRSLQRIFLIFKLCKVMKYT